MQSRLFDSGQISKLNWQRHEGVKARRDHEEIKKNLFHLRACFAIFATSRLCIILILLVGACDRAGAPATTSPAVVTVASLVPAASDLVLGMNARDRLVAVSNYDVPDDRTASLPRVGDYQTVDWEKLAEITPTKMIVQFDPNRIPPGLTQRAGEMGIGVINISNDRLDDIFTTLTQLGRELNMADNATDAAKRLRARLDAVAAGVKGKPPVRTLIVMDDDGQNVVGGDTYLGELLAIAGGVNVLADADKRYLQIDRERLTALAPDAIIQLRPGASPQELEHGKKSMQALKTVPAVRDGRVYVFTEPWVLLPGYRVGELAEKISDALHPAKTGTAPLMTKP
jgi:iron complex transport system substrate-binding protein